MRKLYSILKYICIIALVISLISLLAVVAYVLINGVDKLSFNLLFGEYTNYPNATMIGSVVINKGTKNANVSGNTDNGTANFVNAAQQDYRIAGTGNLSSSVLNESFDINLIGVQSENTIDNIVELAYPANKGNVNADKVKFAWYNAFGATNYKIGRASCRERV